MHPERSDGFGTPPSQRCPDCFTPFAPEDVDRERGFAWCVPCRKAMHLPSSASGPPPSGTARLQRTEGSGLHISWRTRRPLDLLKATFVNLLGMVSVGGGLFLLALNPCAGLVVAAGTLGMGGFAWLQGLRDGSEQVLARGFMDRNEPQWLALELHRALDLATQVELQA